MSVNILAIDGGGMKGIISSIVLMHLEEYLKEYSKDKDAGIVDYFDIVAGTSTGSILTALLLCPDEHGRPKYHPEDALKLYISRGKDLFRKRSFYPVNTLFGLYKSKYTNRYFKEELNKFFGELQISRLLKPCMIITYDMETRKTLFLNSISCKQDPSREMLVKDAVLASCSAPTYFPPVRAEYGMYREHCLIDGGVSANNPAMSALIEALKLPIVKDLRDTYVFSLGNAMTQKNYSCGNTAKWGIVKFALPLISIFMESSEEIVDYQLRKLYECYEIANHYLRIEDVIYGEIPAMDDTSKKAIDTFIKIGDQLSEREEERLRAYAKQLVQRKQKK